MRLLALVLTLGGALAAGSPAAAQGAPEVHGADAVFAGRGIVVAWGVLRGPGDDASVIIRVVSRNPAVQAVAVDLVDPFRGQRVPALGPSPIGDAREIRIPRARFGEHPRLELRLAAGTEILASGTVSFMVYFTGVPDTTPEFASAAALAGYLDAAVARAAH